MLERPAQPQEPRADKRAVTATWHGVTLADDFAWLKAANWQEALREPDKLDPAIRAYLEAENAYADARSRRHGSRCRSGCSPR